MKHLTSVFNCMMTRNAWTDTQKKKFYHQKNKISNIRLTLSQSTEKPLKNRVAYLPKYFSYTTNLRNMQIKHQKPLCMTIIKFSQVFKHFPGFHFVHLDNRRYKMTSRSQIHITRKTERLCSFTSDLSGSVSPYTNPVKYSSPVPFTNKHKLTVVHYSHTERF